MSRFHASTGAVTPSATNFICGTLVPASTGGFKLRRVTWGFTSNNTTPASQQCALTISRITAAYTGGSTITADQLDPNSVPALSTFKAAGTFTVGTSATAALTLPLNSQSAADMPWEQLEEWISAAGANNGFAFALTAAPPSSPTTLVAVNVEWEE